MEKIIKVKRKGLNLNCLILAGLTPVVSVCLAPIKFSGGAHGKNVSMNLHYFLFIMSLESYLVFIENLG